MNSRADVSFVFDMFIVLALVLCAFEALAQKIQKLFRGSKTQLSACVDLFDPAFEMPLLRLRLRC
jgi:hypothetical protein